MRKNPHNPQNPQNLHDPQNPQNRPESSRRSEQAAAEPRPERDPGTVIGAVEDLRPIDVGGQEQPDARYGELRERLLQAETDLRWSQEHLRMVVDGARDYAIFMVDPNGHILTWNTGAERIKQWRADEILGQHFRLLYRPEDRAAGRPEHNLSEARKRGLYEETYPRMKKDGTIFIADVTIHPVWDPASGALRGFSKVVRDVTERHTLLQRLVAAEENERRRISRELHDQTGQHLAALSLGLKSLEGLEPYGNDPEGEGALLLLRLRGIARDLAKDIHRVAVELRPTALDDLGLVPALYGYIERWSAVSGIPAEFDTFGIDGERFSELVETTVYRVVQEALTNITKYAASGADRASRVGVTLQRFEHRLQVTIEDDGPGFDTDSAQRSGRLGLAGMRERAAACGGTLAIESVLSGGSSVFLRIPAELLYATERG